MFIDLKLSYSLDSVPFSHRFPLLYHLLIKLLQTMKLLLPILSAFAALALSFTMSNCASYATGASHEGVSPYLAGYQPAAEKPKVGYWDGDGVEGTALIKINIDRQKAFFYKGGQLVGETPISTGIEGRETPRGRFKVTEKDADHHSNLYGVI